MRAIITRSIGTARGSGVGYGSKPRWTPACLSPTPTCLPPTPTRRPQTPTRRPAPLSPTSLVRRSSTLSPTPTPTPASRAPRAKHRRWTVEEDAVLLECRKAGLKYRQIQIGDRNAVCAMKRMQRLNQGYGGEQIAIEARQVRQRHPPQNAPKMFSEAEKAEVLRLVDAGVNQDRVARKFNVTKEMVWNCWHNSRASSPAPVQSPPSPPTTTTSSAAAAGRFWTNEEIERLKELRAAGFTWPEIARRMPPPHRSILSIKLQWYYKLSGQTDGKASKEHEAPADASAGSRWVRLTPSERIHLLELYQQGVGSAAIARRLGRAAHNVHRVLFGLDVAMRPGQSVQDWSQRLLKVLEELKSKASQPRTLRRFTPAEVESLQHLVEMGASNRYIARFLNRAYRSVVTKMSRLGCNRRPWSKEEQETIRSHQAQGLEPCHIAAKLSRSEHFVRSVLRLPPPERAGERAGHEAE